MLKEKTVVDTRFGLQPVREFDIQVPLDHNPQLHIDGFDGSLIQKFFAGKVYQAKIFLVNSEVSGVDCLNFTKERKAILNSFEGLNLVRLLKPNKLPVGYLHSFDDEDLLLKHDGDFVISCLGVNTPEKIDLCLSYFNGKFGPPVDYLLLMFEK